MNDAHGKSKGDKGLKTVHDDILRDDVWKHAFRRKYSNGVHARSLYAATLCTLQFG
jgi:hypothetical protein